MAPHGTASGCGCGLVTGVASVPPNARNAAIENLSRDDMPAFLVPVDSALARLSRIGIAVAGRRRNRSETVGVHFPVRKQRDLLQHAPDRTQPAGSDDAARHKDMALRVGRSVDRRVLVF